MDSEVVDLLVECLDTIDSLASSVENEGWGCKKERELIARINAAIAPIRPNSVMKEYEKHSLDQKDVSEARGGNGAGF